MIAALFVQTGGCYFSPGFDPWDEPRDARRYAGPQPVIAHPPCQRWGKFWSGGPSAPSRKALGDDGGCFASALRSVRTFGGVIEHPAHSHAWRAFGLAEPPREGGWIWADQLGGRTCHVEQGHYGHRARKATWLYVCSVQPVLPALKWGSSQRQRQRQRQRMPHWVTRPPADLSPEWRQLRRQWLAWYEQETGRAYCCAETMSKRERAATPIPFRDLLASLALAARG